MKKRFVILAMIVLAMAAVMPAQGEGTIQNVEGAMEFFEGIWGDIIFHLPGYPERIRDGDMDDGWTDNWQLMGNCMEDNAEYQMHMADIAPLVDYFINAYPREGKNTCRAQALLNYAMFIPGTYGAQIENVESGKEDGSDNIWVDVEFTYPDVPDIPYMGHFMLSGTKAVCLVMVQCDHAAMTAEGMRFITAEEREAWLAKKQQQFFSPLYGLQMTFPAQTRYFSTEEIETVACFTADWGMIQVQYNPIGMTLDDETEETILEAMEKIARDYMLLPYETEARDPILSRPAEHTAQLDFSFTNQMSLGEYGQKMLGRLYVGEYGIWYLYAPDDETGREFLAHTFLADEEQMLADNGNADSENTGYVPEPLNEAETISLPVFRDRLEKLMNNDIPGFQWKPGNLYWSDAVFCGGEWVRGMYNTSADIGAALIHLDSSRDDAAVREIIMLRYADTEDGKDDWRRLSELCALALRGDKELTEEHLEPEESALVYDRVRLQPIGTIPQIAEDIPYPEGQSIEPIPDSGVTVKTFEERLRSLLYMDVQFYMQQENMYIYVVEDQALIQVVTDGKDDDAPISMVIIMGMAEEAAPAVVSCTSMAFGAMTGMTQAESLVTVYALMETPMWYELADLWPLLSRGNIAAHLQDTMIDNEWIPMGFVAARPE